MTGDNLAIPYAISVDGLLEVISAWNRLPNPREAASKKDVADVCRLSAESVRKQNPFLEQVGFLTKEENLYRLTETGLDLAKLADYMQLDEFGSRFTGIVANWKQLAPIIEYVKNVSGERDEIITRIILHSGRARDNKDTISGATALLDLMVTTGIFLESDGKVSLSSSFESKRNLDTEVHQFVSTQTAESIQVSIRVDIRIEGGAPTTEQNRILENLISSLRSIGLTEISVDE